MPLILVLHISFLCAQNAEPIKRPPNIILIIADDLGYADLGITGSRQIRTPNIDKLAANGIFFSQAYVSSAVCSPSRAGLITGRNQVNFGYDNNLAGTQVGFDPEFLGLPIEVSTIPNYLDSLDYINGLIGKWHLGYKEQFHPLNRGFHEFWGYRGGGHDYFRSEAGKSLYLTPIESNYTEPKAITYLSDDKGRECVSFIDRHKDEAFFLYASFNAPHTPMQAKQEDLQLYSFIQNEKRRTYAAMVHRLDINVGRIVAAVEKNGLLENTIFVFLSDNGGPVYTNGSLNRPFNGKKGSLLEGGIRVPFIISWKGHLQEGVKNDAVVSSLDLAPTFLSIAGANDIENKNFDGVNLMPFLREETLEQPHGVLKWRFTVSASIRKGDWKLVRLPDRLPMLYHLPSDLSESKDLFMVKQELAQRLLKELGTWDVNLPHPVFLEGAQWKARQLAIYDETFPMLPPE